MKTKLLTQRGPADGGPWDQDRQPAVAGNREQPSSGKPVGRRHFLKALGVAVTAPLLVPASVLGRAGTVAPSARIAVGMVGTGNQGTYHTRLLCGAPEAQVVAVCDPVRAKREAARRAAENAYAQSRGAGSSTGCAVYNDFRELLARPDIDAVFIASPEHWHALHAVAAAHAGNGSDHTGPVEVEGRASFPTDGLNDTAATWHVEFAYANGVRLIFTSDDENPYGIRFDGTEGSVFVNRSGIKAQPESLLGIRLRGNDVRLYESQNHHLDFLRSVKTRQDPICLVEVGHHTYVICNLSDIAVRLERKLRWDPARERFPDDDQANRTLSRALRPPWTV